MRLVESRLFHGICKRFKCFSKKLSSVEDAFQFALPVFVAGRFNCRSCELCRELARQKKHIRKYRSPWANELILSF